MKVVGHDHKIMEQKLALAAVTEKDIDKQISGSSALEERSPLRGH